MSFKKRVKAPVEKSEGADINVVSNDENISRLWFKGKINNQLFNMLLDCGASVCCIAKRCVTSNNVLKSLPKLSYDGPGLVDVNGNSLTAEGKIRSSLTVGTSGLSLNVDFVIVDGLPYSCIAGHFKEDRTWSNFVKYYFWPGAHNDVINWVRSCECCNKFDTFSYIYRPLHPIPVENRFEFVCYDLAGPFLPKNSRGNLYALIMVDHFTKWPEIFPLIDSTAPTIARMIFEQWCCRYGVMDRLHSDGASNVHGEVVLELCKHIGAIKSKSSRLHPQGDGMAESTVKILKSCIKKQVDRYGQDWDLFLHSTAFSIRSNINSSTKFTPAELILGENLKRPIDISSDVNFNCNNEPSGSNFNKRQAKEFAASLVEKMNKSADIVRENVTLLEEK